MESPGHFSRAMSEMKKTNAIWDRDFDRRRRRIRLRIATNLFKRFLLGDRHLGGEAQVSAVFNELASLGGSNLHTESTWASWFAEGSREPKRSKIQALDDVAQQSFKWTRPSDRASLRLPVRFFEELVFGGVLSTLTATTESKRLRSEVQARAARYEPLSAWHLHADALEISAQFDAFGELPWHDLKSIGATRVLELVNDLWKPRGGSIFKAFSSPLRLQWEDATPAQREEIWRPSAGLVPDPFDRLMNCGAAPEWDRTGVRSDAAAIHVYKTLFSIAADTEFLVADRLAAWTLDLATAGLAMFALAWSHRYDTFGLHGEDEVIFWRALSAILFGTAEAEDFEDCMEVAMHRCDSSWPGDPFNVFRAAQQSYELEVTDIGLRRDELREFVFLPWSNRPMRYQSSFRRSVPLATRRPAT